MELGRHRIKVMKKFLLVALLLYATGALAQKVKLYSAGRVAYECNVEQLDSIVFNKEDTPDVGVEHEWVDLGLPSGTLWATCNVGSSKPEENGDYFAWGETSPKESYNRDNYKYGIDLGPGDWKVMKYCTLSEFGYGGGLVDNITELQPEDDAATVNWGSEWQTPSLAQLQELFSDYCTTATWITQNSVNGILIKSKKNGNTIFLPAAGKYYDSYQEAEGRYWSRSLNTEKPIHAHLLQISNEGFSYYMSKRNYRYNHDYRYVGINIRPVRKK